MTIYIDNPKKYPGVRGQWAHMATDGDLTELHQFAKKIGLKEMWFQDHPRVPHYDITQAKRLKAFKLGAKPATTVEIAKLCQKKCAEDKQVIVLNVEDEHMRKAILYTQMRATFFTKPCPHCGVEFTDDDIEHGMIGSFGGKYAMPSGGGVIAAHPHCFYIHEADDAWRAAHPEAAQPDADTSA